MHMPRWASRLSLTVVSVSVAPLQDILPDEIVAEGQVGRFMGVYWRWRSPCRGIWLDPKRAFARLWNATRATDGERWDDNPMVAIITFQPIN